MSFLLIIIYLYLIKLFRTTPTPSAQFGINLLKYSRLIFQSKDILSVIWNFFINPLHKKNNNFKVFQEWVRDFDAMSYSKGETYKVSPFFVSGVIPDHIYIPPQPLLWQRRGLCGREYYMLAGYALQEGGKANCCAI